MMSDAAPDAAYVLLDDRGLLAVAGADRRAFLQGLISNDVDKVTGEQAELLIGRIRVSEPPVVAVLAHTLKGSALGIGATNVARAAAATELAASGGVAECRLAVGRLAAAVEEARTTIAALLHTD